MSQDVVLILFMQLGRTIFHGFLDIEYKGIFFIFDFNGTNRSGGGNFILRDNSRDIITIEADSVRQKKTVLNVLMMRIGRPRVAGCRKVVLRHIEARNYFNNAGNLLGYRCVDL